jgi:hypothetical protein
MEAVFENLDAKKGGCFSKYLNKNIKIEVLTDSLEENLPQSPTNAVSFDQQNNLFANLVCTK